MYLLYEGLRKYINPCIAGKYASFLFFPVEGVRQAPCIVCRLWVACEGTFIHRNEAPGKVSCWSSDLGFYLDVWAEISCSMPRRKSFGHVASRNAIKF